MIINAILQVKVQFVNDDNNVDYGLSDVQQAGIMHLASYLYYFDFIECRSSTAISILINNREGYSLRLQFKRKTVLKVPWAN